MSILAYAQTSYLTASTKPLSCRLPASKSPEWSRASALARLVEAYSVIDKEGGQIFTLRLNTDALISVTGAEDPTRTMSKRIQRAFKLLGFDVADFAFQLEVARENRQELHLHGAINPGNIPTDIIIAALRQAGGRINGRAGSRQVHLMNFEEGRGGPAGWARYGNKAAALTKRVIQHHRLIYICRNLNRKAKARWEERRTEVRSYH